MTTDAVTLWGVVGGLIVAVWSIVACLTQTRAYLDGEKRRADRDSLYRSANQRTPDRYHCPVDERPLWPSYEEDEEGR